MNQGSKRRTNSGFSNNQKMVTVKINGQTTRVLASDMGRGATILHGTASCGTEVNSPRTKYIGDSVGISPSAKGNNWITMPEPDAELMAIDIRKRRGFTITAPVAGASQQ